MREESGTECRNGGWIHQLKEGQVATSQLPVYKKPVRKSTIEFNSIQAELWRSGCVMVDGASYGLGITCPSLRRLGIGYLKDSDADTFPMKNEVGEIVGIRIRQRRTGSKWAYKGGGDGLFVPEGFKPWEPYAIVEGPTNTGTMLDWGIECIGRPNNLGGLGIILDLITKYSPPSVLIIGDNDKINPKTGKRPGEQGVNQLMLQIVENFRHGRATAIYPPKGINDVRAWKKAGGTRADVVAAAKDARRTSFTG